MKYKELDLDNKYLVLMLDNEILPFDIFIKKLGSNDFSSTPCFEKNIFLNYMYLEFFKYRIKNFDKLFINNYNKNLEKANDNFMDAIKYFKDKKQMIYHNLQHQKVDIETNEILSNKNYHRKEIEEKLLFIKESDELINNISTRSMIWDNIVNDYHDNKNNNKYDDIQKEQLKILIKTNYINELNRFVRAMILFQEGR